ncbi:MAG: 50S ribosomal protein L3 [bacterium]|nr:50S ribosomal protein L3 [bacterium]
MTKLWVGKNFISATMLMILPQEILRYKTQENDGYTAVVVGVGKKELKDKQKGNKVSYTRVLEFSVDDEFITNHKIGESISIDLLDGVETVATISNAKGKGFQGVMKRFHTKGGPKTHGSKFHRQVGSLGNRKPRRVQKGHPHA